ncbi:MAG: peroxide stress protein YaaA [Oligoflexia bacterium]|nr:peroxide stress protein YaaA [Oligoflexia bacterium]
MLALLSPAKRLDFDTPPAVSAHSRPQMLDQTARLIETARKLSQDKLRELMGISPALAKLNAVRFQRLSTELDLDNAKQAALAFKGDTYVGLDADSLGDDDLAWAQDHIGILSGLYGYLRPLDLIQPYRLEMGTRLKTRSGPSLYAFWGDRITAQVQDVLDAQGDTTVVNLASAEYFKAVNQKKLAARVLTPVFMDTKDGRSRVLSLFAKQARGMMARTIIDNRLDDVDALKDFGSGGYRFRADQSEGDRWVFERTQPPPVRR